MNFFNPYYGSLFFVPRQIIKIITSVLFPLVKIIFEFPKVATVEETIQKLVQEKTSIVRFGDGEILYIVDKRPLPFQDYDVNLSKRLKEILITQKTNILIGLPDAFRVNTNKEISTFWKSQITWTYPRFREYLNLNKQYYNASITRLYYGSKDINKTKMLFEEIIKIWENRMVLIIEGEKTRFGIGNNLLEKAKQVERIIGPYHHAFNRTKDILIEALKHERSKVVLVAMGPAAKVITFDLALAGFQAIDIGNLDIEYEWFLRGVKKRIPIPGKYTSEAKGGREVEDIKDSIYESQIIARFI